jgi:predicted metal-dependent peptidase
VTDGPFPLLGMILGGLLKGKYVCVQMVSVKRGFLADPVQPCFVFRLAVPRNNSRFVRGRVPGAVELREETMSAARQKRVEKAQMRVLFTVPFFAPGVAKLPVEFRDDVPTACTNGERIVFGTKFFDSLKDQEIVTVLCHEVAHCMYGHCWRMPSGADPETWNIAVDHHVNTMLKDFSALVKAKNLADPFPFPDPQDAYCADPQYRDITEELTYHKLARQKPPGGGGKGKPGAGKPAPGSMPSFGQVEPVKGQSAAKAKQLQNDWTATLLQSAQMASGRGELPDSMARLVDHLVNPQVPWPEVLRSWLREQCADDWNWLEPAMAFEGSGFILPDLKSEKMGPVVFATDTSGSITPELLAQFQSEKQSCLDEMRPSKLVDIYCDAKIQKVVEYSSGDAIGRDGPGGGGTSFVPVFEYVGKMPVAPKCVVYLTDLCGDFPPDPGIPTIWVTWEKGGKAPFGEVVYAVGN